jgi:hypothetical protein
VRIAKTLTSRLFFLYLWPNDRGAVSPFLIHNRLLNSAASLFLLICYLFGASASALRAQLSLPGTFLSRSVSGQFLIQGSAGSHGAASAGLLENNTNFVRLDPTLLTVSCERIKQLVWRNLKATTPWRGKIFFRLYPANSAEDSVLIESEQFSDGWQYRVLIPNICQRERYVRTVVAVVLLELANRNPGLHSAEVPTWLTEGLSREIWASNQKEIILPPPQLSEGGLRMSTLMVNTHQENPLEQAHQELCTGAPLSFQQLSWPVPDPATGEPSELYRSSAQVFLHQLLNLPNGSACLRVMVENLPRFYNWQFAFREAFRDLFPQPLDVEKWWSLQLAHFTGRELGQNWTREESWQKLDDTLRSAVQIRVGTNELPLHAEVTLQTIVTDWPPPRQKLALEGKLRELQMLRPRLAADLAPFVDEYCRAIESYLQNLNHPGFVLPFRKGSVIRRNASETFRQLEELDARRVSLRPTAKPELPVQADSR